MKRKKSTTSNSAVACYIYQTKTKHEKMEIKIKKNTTHIVSSGGQHVLPAYSTKGKQNRQKTKQNKR